MTGLVERVWRRARPLTRSLVVWGVLAWLAWLDRDAVAGVQHAAIFSAIVGIFKVIFDVIGSAAGAIAATLEGVVAWLVSAFAWLSHVVVSLLTSTGALFAKAWQGLKVVWTDVLKPALVWVDQQLKRLQAWLKDTFKPVFDWLKRVRDELTAIYKRFVQPIIDTIEFIRRLNSVLLAFHIHVLQKVDRVLQQIEQRLEEPILWLNAQINKIWNALELVVTADGFFQKLTLIRSMNRYVPEWLRIATNARTRPLNGDELATLNRAFNTQAPSDLVADLSDYMHGGTNDAGDTVNANVDRATAYWARLA